MILFGESGIIELILRERICWELLQVLNSRPTMPNNSSVY